MSLRGFEEKYRSFIENHEEQFKEWKIGFKIVWSNPLMKIGIILMLSLIIIAIFAPWISPYPEDAMTVGTSYGGIGNTTVYSNFKSYGFVSVGNYKEWTFTPHDKGSTTVTVGNASMTMVVDNQTEFSANISQNTPVKVKMNMTIFIEIKNVTTLYVNLTDIESAFVSSGEQFPTYVNVGGRRNVTLPNTTTNVSIAWNTLISIKAGADSVKIDASTTVNVIIISENRMGKIGVDFWRPPSWQHPFGTDYYDRDVMSRVFFGTRIALMVAVIVVALSMLIGVPLGAFAGYYGGAMDEIIMRITDIFLAFPALLLAMVLSVTFGPNLMNAMFAIAIAWWPWYTRIMRNMVLSLRERPYVMAAKAAGIKNMTIISKFIFPNSLAPIIVQATLDMGTVILAEAALAFLGLGAQPPTPDWGLMISKEATYITQGIWWSSVFPGIFIFLTVISFNLIGDALREFLDPKVRLKRFR